MLERLMNCLAHLPPLLVLLLAHLIPLQIGLLQGLEWTWLVFSVWGQRSLPSASRLA
jgi:hypothetical protein